MRKIIEITDLSAAELDIYARLSEVQLLRYREPENGIFIAESPKVIGRALDAGYEPVSFLAEKGQLEGEAQEILERCPKIPIYIAETEVLTKLTGFKLTRGILCAMNRRTLPNVEAVCTGARRIAVLENVVNPTNIGAIFRSAAALHMDAVLLTQGCSDPLYRRAARVSMGTVFQIPWTYMNAHTMPESGNAEINAQILPESEGAEISAQVLPESEGAEINAQLLPESEGAEINVQVLPESEGTEINAQILSESEGAARRGCDRYSGKKADAMKEGGLPQGPKGEQAAEQWTAYLRGLGFKTAALALCDDSLSIDDPQLAKAQKLAIVLGTEGDGLAKKTIADCDYTVKIPMSHGVDSLNVAAAGAVAFWELGKWQ